MPRAQKRRAEECSGEHGCVNEEAPAALRRRTEAHQNVAEKVAEAAQEVQMVIECPVCLTRPASTAFACGHCFCSQDGCPSSTVESCPTCRESVQQRIKLFGFGSIESLLDLLSECDVSDLSAAEGTQLQPSNGSLAAVLPGSDTTTLPGPPEGGMARGRFVSVGSKVVAHFAGRKGYAGWYDATISSVRGDSDTCVVQWHDGETRDTIKRSCELCIPLTTLESASGSAASDREQLGELFKQQEQHERALKRFAVDSEALEQERKRVAKELKKEKHRLLLAQEELDVQKQEREELETRFRRLERDLTKKLEVANNEINCLRRTETLAAASKLEVDARLEASEAETEQVKADRDRLKRCLLEMDDDLTKEQALRKTYSQVMAAVLEVVPGFSFDAAESDEGRAVGQGNGDSKVDRFICELVDSARKAEDSVGDDVFRVVRAKINSARKPAVSGAQAEKDESAAALSVQPPQGSESGTQCPACAKVFVNQLAVVRHLVDKNDEQHRNYRATFTRGACLIGEKPHLADETSAEADATDRYEYSRSQWKRKKRLVKQNAAKAAGAPVPAGSQHANVRENGQPAGGVMMAGTPLQSEAPPAAAGPAEAVAEAAMEINAGLQTHGLGGAGMPAEGGCGNGTTPRRDTGTMPNVKTAKRNARAAAARKARAAEAAAARQVESEAAKAGGGKAVGGIAHHAIAATGAIPVTHVGLCVCPVLSCVFVSFVP